MPVKVNKTISLCFETNSMLRKIAHRMGEKNHSKIVDQLIRDEFNRRGMKIYNLNEENQI